MATLGGLFRKRGLRRPVLKSLKWRAIRAVGRASHFPPSLPIFFQTRRLSGYFPRTRFSCSHMVVKAILYCTRNVAARPAASQQDAFCSHLATVQQVSLPEGTPQGTSYSIKTRRSPPRSNEEAQSYDLVCCSVLQCVALCCTVL